VKAKPSIEDIQLAVQTMKDFAQNLEPYLESFLKLHKALKKKGLNPDNVGWFVDLIELGVVKLPELSKYLNNR
jgi:hypothetical protein